MFIQAAFISKPKAIISLKKMTKRPVKYCIMLWVSLFFLLFLFVNAIPVKLKQAKNLKDKKKG